MLHLDIASHVNDVARGALANSCSENLVIFRVGKWQNGMLTLSFYMISIQTVYFDKN